MVVEREAGDVSRRGGAVAIPPVRVAHVFGLRDTLHTSRHETAAPDVCRIAGFDFRWRVAGTRTPRSGSHGYLRLDDRAAFIRGSGRAFHTGAHTAPPITLDVRAVPGDAAGGETCGSMPRTRCRTSAFLPLLWFDRDLSFDNEYRALYDRGVAQFAGFRETYLETVTETGLRLNFGTLGPAILWAPFYAIADAAPSHGSPLRRDDRARRIFASIHRGGLLRIGDLWLPRASAPGADRPPAHRHGHPPRLVIWVGTPLLFYMYLAAGMAHAVSAFAVAAMLTIWIKVRARWTGLVEPSRSAQSVA